MFLNMTANFEYGNPEHTFVEHTRTERLALKPESVISHLERFFFFLFPFFQ
jgi:hypothetical protein